MPDAISNTSPLVYLHRIDALAWLPRLFGEVWTPAAVRDELGEGLRKGYNIPRLTDYAWLKIVDPRVTPIEWLALDLGPGELAAMALGLENPAQVLLLDDLLARRTAQAAGLKVWGTLKIVLEAKTQGLISSVAPVVNRLSESGLWVAEDVRQRILVLAGEESTAEAG